MKDKKPLKPKKIYTLKRTPIVLSQKSIDKMNKKRLEKAKSQISVKKPIVFKKASNTVKTKIKQVSKKQSAINKQMTEVKRKITEDALTNDTYYCKGCGLSKTGLDKSHIISIGKRKDLELIERNITLHCRECHLKWEGGDISKMVQMLDFEDNLQWIKENDESIYQKIIQEL